MVGVVSYHIAWAGAGGVGASGGGRAWEGEYNTNIDT
jgi:hypothetical protein